MSEQNSGKKTFWQLVKFTIVSMLACIVQVASLAALYNIPAIKALSAQAFHWFVFDYPVIEGKQCGLALFIAFNTSNILAQIVAFFVNRKKTFNADNNVPVTLTIYLVFTLALICFSAWFNPVVFECAVSKGVSSGLSTTIATAVCSCIQFFIYFPVDKLLMRQKKEKKD
jgi:putative flippase GtrA